MFTGTYFTIFYGTILVLVRTLITPKRLEGEDCGIPIIWWNETWLTILGCVGFAGLLVVLVGLIFANFTATSATLGVSMALIIPTLLGWTIYGYILIFDPMNDCGLNPETSGW